MNQIGPDGGGQGVGGKRKRVLKLYLHSPYRQPASTFTLRQSLRMHLHKGLKGDLEGKKV